MDTGKPEIPSTGKRVLPVLPVSRGGLPVNAGLRVTDKETRIIMNNNEEFSHILEFSTVF